MEGVNRDQAIDMTTTRTTIKYMLLKLQVPEGTEDLEDIKVEVKTRCGKEPTVLSWQNLPETIVEDMGVYKA